jgi:hypothetical protein
MIYEQPDPADPLTQGDILDDCPIVFWELPGEAIDAQPESQTTRLRVVVLTQACDLAQVKTTRVLVAVMQNVQHLVARGVLSSKTVREQVRLHRVYGWYFLPAAPPVEESIIDLHDLHTIPRLLLEGLIQRGKRVSRLRTPYREHLGQHFATTYARIALPEPYPTQPDS